MLKVYNTLDRKIEEFKPINPDSVSFYTCGPTVYDYAHIGNLRAYLSADIIERTLEYLGFNVKHVINITDVGHLVSDADEGEDKMLKGLKREGLDKSIESMVKLAQIYTDKFIENLEDLNIEMPTKWTKATEYVPEMIEIVADLIEKGIVYETSTAFYFDTSQYKDYAKLGNLQLDELKAGARIEVDEEKRNPADFAVWLKAKDDNEGHLMVWEAPFSDVMGFPGWHIECSAMAMKELGETIDIHSGGIDHIQVHHTNEIAQSEAHTGKHFVNYWLHNEFLILDKGKMSKSDGSFITLQTVIDKGINPLAYRYLLLQAHYRSPLTFTWESLEDAGRGLNTIRDRFLALGVEDGNVNEQYQQEFESAVEDDFNTPKGLAVFQQALKDANLSDADKRATLIGMDRVLGLGLVDWKEEVFEVPAEIKALADERLEAKKGKDYETADALRDKIATSGWVVEDVPGGYNLKKT